MGTKAPEDRLLPITVRFTPDAWEAIRDIARSNCISQAELVRMAVSGNLGRYLGTIRVIDQAQADELKDEIARLFTVMSEIKGEINKIGVNYNQVVKNINIARKYGGRGAAGNGAGALPPMGALDTLMDRYERATEGVSDLCRFLV